MAGQGEQPIPGYLAWFGGNDDASAERAKAMPVRLGLFVLWLAAVLFMASRHVMWRDEVRALSLALQGDSLKAMLVGLRGEGHPALWYVNLRGLHALVPVNQVLQVAALAIGIAAMAVLTFRAPFRPVVIALIMASGFGLYDFTVLARNYGVTMLLLFLFAALYRRGQERGWVLPLLLFLLCQTNVHAVLLAGGLVLVLASDVLARHGPAGLLHHRVLLASGFAVLLGAAACYWEVSFPLQDAVHFAGEPSGLARLHELPRELILPGSGFGALAPAGPASNVYLLSLVLWLALGGLVARPGLLLAGLAVQLAMCALFVVVYPGAYRHAALYLAFLITLYWLAAEGSGGRWPARTAILQAARPFGVFAMLALLVMQLPVGLRRFDKLAHGLPESSSKALGALLARPDLRQAVVMADPDFDVEALPYYAANPTYLPREERFGQVVRFVSHARLAMSLGDLLDTARRVAAQTGRPVVILTADPVETVTSPTLFTKGYVWTLTVTPDQVREFTAATRRLQRFDSATTDENYTAWLLRPPAS